MPNKTTASVEPLFYSIQEAADRLAVSRWMVYKLADSGHLPSVYQQSRRYITVAGLNEYVASLSSTPTASADA